jgi:hypothetical protein
MMGVISIPMRTSTISLTASVQQQRLSKPVRIKRL